MEKTEEFIQEVYLRHLDERFQLLKYYIVIYGAIFGSEIALFSKSEMEKLPIISFFTILLSLLLYSLDRRIFKLIEVHREWLQIHSSDARSIAMQNIKKSLENKKLCCFCRIHNGDVATGTLIITFFFFMGIIQVLIFILVILTIEKPY